MSLSAYVFVTTFHAELIVQSLINFGTEIDQILEPVRLGEMKESSEATSHS